jgi:TonB family protein
MDVTDVLRDRMQAPAGLQRMVTVSVAVHALMLTVLLFAPGGLIRRTSEPARTVMTISLSGGTGPQNGGLTPMSGRPVQEQTPPDTPAKPEPIRPPAAKTPEMTVPLRGAKPVKVPPNTTVKQAPDEARGRTPTRGAQTSPGTAIADTGVRGQGFGLSTGGGPGTGSSLDITGDFCCPGYLATMIDAIKRAWVQNQGGAVGQSIVKFTIQRDGSITNVSVERQSGNYALDAAAQRAVVATRTLPPLPGEFPNSTLTVHLSFLYQ